MGKYLGKCIFMIENIPYNLVAGIKSTWYSLGHVVGRICEGWEDKLESRYFLEWVENFWVATEIDLSLE